MVLTILAALAGCTSAEEPPYVPGTIWEPDDALQRAQAALKDDDTPSQLVLKGAPYVAGGLDKTLETGGTKPYRFDAVCDSTDVPKVTLNLSRGTSRKQFDIDCKGTNVVRINFPAGAPVTVKIAPATGKPTPMGLVAWYLMTLDPANVHGCTNDIDGC
ncbi:hypothetical protein ACWEPM_38105 [Streptomyces sp. NPDC004244]